MGDQCFKLFVLRILRCNAPFLVSSARLFRKKKQPRPSVFWKARRHWGRGWVEKMGWVYLSSVNSRRIIRLWQIIRLQNPSKKTDKVRRIIRPNWTTAVLHLRWIIRLRQTIYPQNPSKLTEKQMDKVRRIVHAKLRPVHFQITTYYLSDANYPTDNSSQTDNPSPVWKRQLLFNTAPN